MQARAEALEARCLLTSINATIINNTGFPLVFDAPDSLPTIENFSGSLPPATIPNGGQAHVNMDSFGAGVQGHFYFFVGNTGVKADIYMDNPLIGSDTFTASLSPDNGYFQATEVGSSGEPATPVYTLSSIGGNLGVWGNVTAGPTTPGGSAETIPSSDGAMNMLLLPNGDVMIHGDGDGGAADGYGPNSISPNWYLLTPDSSGSYSGNNVQLTSFATMEIGRRFFASQVLPNDSVFVYGGEYALANMTGNTILGSGIISGLSSTSQLEVGMQVTGFGIPGPTTITGTTGNGSFVITGLASTSDLFPGMTVSGTGIPSGTAIAGINAASSSITLTQAANASGTNSLMFNSTIEFINSAADEIVIGPGARATLNNVSLEIGGGQVEEDQGEYLNLVASSPAWEPLETIPSNLDTSGVFGDQQTDLLSNGTLLSADPASLNSFVWSIPSNPANDGSAAWTATGNDMTTVTSKGLTFGGDNEDNWVLLPGGDVLDYEIKVSDANANPAAELYVPSGNAIPANDNNGGAISTGQWVNASQGLIQLTAGGNNGPTDMGPGVLLPFYAPFHGPAVFYIGWNGATDYYNPATNTWADGPAEPTYMGQQMSSADSPAAVLPDGDVLLALSPEAPAFPTANYYAPPTQIYLFNPNAANPADSFQDVTPPDPTLAMTNDYQESMLELPSGQILMSDSSNTLWIYTPTGSTATPAAGSVPTISSITTDPSTGQLQINGTELDGADEGGYYGDDEQMLNELPDRRVDDDVRPDCLRHHEQLAARCRRGRHANRFRIPGGN